MSKVYGYVRVSTEAQAKHGHSLGNQARQIDAYCMSKDLELEDTFTDAAETAATPLIDRPAGREMLSLLQPGDHVVITKLDRAWRSVLDAEGTLSDWRDREITPHILNLPVDFSTPMGRFFFTLLAAFAEFERTVIAERIREGVRAKIAKTGRCGGVPRYGWVADEEGRIIADADEQAVMAVAVSLRSQGMSQRKIARQLSKGGYRNRLGEPFLYPHVRKLLDSYDKGPPPGAITDALGRRL